MTRQLGVSFHNKTGRAWLIGIYQVLTDSDGFDSVVWRLGNAKPDGKVEFRWNESHEVVLGEFSHQGVIEVYMASQVVPSPLGRKWEVVYADGFNQLRETGAADKHDELVIRNVGSRNASVGVAMDGAAFVYKRVPQRDEAKFKVHATYWAALFNDLVHGQVISSKVTIEPLMLPFEDGDDHIEVEAWMEDETVHFAIVDDGRRRLE